MPSLLYSPGRSAKERSTSKTDANFILAVILRQKVFILKR